MALSDPTNTSSHIRVRRGAIGILRKGDRFLLVRRAEGIAMGGFWCFPGGHVESGETSRQAVTRELEEELGIVVQPLERLGALRVLGGTYVLAVWLVGHSSGHLRPAPDEIAEVRWLREDEIRSIEPALASNRQVMEMMESHDRKTPG